VEGHDRQATGIDLGADFALFAIPKASSLTDPDDTSREIVEGAIEAASASAAPGRAARTATPYTVSKGRSEHQPVAVLVGGVDQAEDIGVLDRRARALMQAFWPGPLTIIVPRRSGLGWELGEPSTTIGLRWPASDLVETVARAVGPLAVTSANRHGEPTPALADEAAAALASEVAVTVDRGPLEGSASTVVDLVGPRATLLREGDIGDAEVAAALG
ncbi:MAG: Sua5/YciO/YrdC/YwlC family protein, partial [Actinomycetota bacterium]